MLHEILLWLGAGILNVQAERVLKWPEAQEASEIRLNFVQISRRASALRRAVIVTVPMLAGMVVLGYIAQEQFRISTVVQTISTGTLDDVGRGIGLLTSVPDFWLWFYLAFTVGNTMFPPNSKDLRGWRVTLLPALGVAALLVFLGAGSGILAVIQPAIFDLLEALSGIFVLLIGINLTAVLILGTIESVIERVTGHSATFRKGKLIAMTRAERLELEQRERERSRKRAIVQTQRSGPAPAISTVYQLILPVPGPPGVEPVSQPAIAILDDSVSTPTKGRSSRSPAALIAGEAKPSTRELPLPDSDELPAPRISIPKPMQQPEKAEESTKPDTASSPRSIGGTRATGPLKSSPKPASDATPPSTRTGEDDEGGRQTKVTAAEKPAAAVDTAEGIPGKKDQSAEEKPTSPLKPSTRPPAASPFSRPSLSSTPAPETKRDGDTEQPALKPKDQPPARPAISPFGRPSVPADVHEENEEEEITSKEASPTPRPASGRPAFGAPRSPFGDERKPPASPFGKPPTPTEEQEEENDETSTSKPAAPTPRPASGRPAFGTPRSPFGDERRPAISPFGKPPTPADEPKEEDDEEILLSEDDEDEPRRPTLRGVLPVTRSTTTSPRPSTSAFASPDDDEDEEEEESTSLLRSRSASDAISSLFADMKFDSEDDSGEADDELSYEDDDEYSAYDDDEESSTYLDD